MVILWWSEGLSMALLVLTVPVTRLLLSGGEPARPLLGYSLIGLCLGTLALSTFLAELFPTRLRSAACRSATAWRAPSSAARPRPWPCS